MPDWTASGRVKIERAKEHISNLEAEIATFAKSDPYKVVPEIDKQTGEVVVCVRVKERPPLRWGTLAGDAVHNLRSALNILWRTVWPVPVRDKSRKDSFPIFDSAKVFKTRFRGVKEPARQAVMDILKALEPYKPGDEGGNALLWKLGVVNDTDKHHLLITIYVHFGEGVLTITPKGGEPEAFHMGMRGPAVPVEDGTVLLRVRKPTRGGVEMKMDVEVVFPVAFAEPEIVKGEAIIPTLHQLAGEVDGIVETFARAGLLP